MRKFIKKSLRNKISKNYHNTKKIIKNKEKKK